MIRKFCFFIILFSSFFIIDKVSAAQYNAVFNYDTITINETNKAVLDYFIESFDSCGFDNYVIRVYVYEGNLDFFSFYLTDNNNVRLSSIFHGNSGDYILYDPLSTSFYYYESSTFGFRNSNIYNFANDIKSKCYSSSYISSKKQAYPYAHVSDFASLSNFNDIRFDGTNSNTFIYASTIPFNLKKEKISSYSVIDLSILKNGNTDFFQAGIDEDLYLSYSDFSKPKIPTINLNLSYSKYNDNNEPIQAKINVDWAIKDLNSYKYMWKSVNDDNWRYFFSEDVTDEILINRNGSYIFQVNDSDDNYITSASITLTSLIEQLPTLKLDDYTGVGCYYENQQYCKILTLYSENADFSKYTLQYRFSNGEWITHNYDNSVKGQIKIYENTTLTARLIRNSDNELIDSKSYTITNINTEILTDVPKIKFDKTFCKNLDPENFHEIGQGNFKQTLKMTIYGLDMTKYRVFIAEKNTNNFVEITDFEYEDRVPLVKYYYFEYYQDTTFFVKITDLDGNYVTGTAYTLHFTCNDISTELDDLNDINDIFDVVKNFFNKFKDIMLKFKEVIEYFYNSLNSEIKAFILTAFILIIVLNLIMRMMK